MSFLRRHWYNLGLGVAILCGIYLAFAWEGLDVLRRLLLLNFLAILLHQFEEYGFPGGEPAIMNRVLQPSPTPERYPLNQQSAMVTNVVASYLFYLIPVFVPTVIWLGLAPMLFGILQVIVHGIATNVKLKRLYNPGLGAVILLHIPLGAYYIYYIQSKGLASLADWVLAVVYVGLVAFLVVNKMTYTWLSDKNSPYPFTEEEMKRFSVQEKLKAIAR